MPISKNYSDRRYHNLSEEMCVFVVYDSQTIIDFIFLMMEKYSAHGSDQAHCILLIIPSSKQDSGRKTNHTSCICAPKISDRFSGSKLEPLMSDRLPITKMRARRFSAGKRRGIFHSVVLQCFLSFRKAVFNGDLLSSKRVNDMKNMK